MVAELAEKYPPEVLAPSWQPSPLNLQKHGVLDLERLIGGKVEDWSVGDFALRPTMTEALGQPDYGGHTEPSGSPVLAREEVISTTVSAEAPASRPFVEAPGALDGLSEPGHVSCRGRDAESEQLSDGISDLEESPGSERVTPDLILVEKGGAEDTSASDRLASTLDAEPVVAKGENADHASSRGTVHNDEMQKSEPENAQQVSRNFVADEKAPKRKALFNASHCLYDVVLAVAEERAWRIVKQEERAGPCNTHWIDDANIGVWLPRIEPWMRVNHFPGMNNCLARKSRLARNLARMQRLFPTDYRFIPPTWVLPDDLSDLTKRFGSNGETKAIYIVKPDHLCQGRGIFLTTDPEKIKKCAAEGREKDQAIVVQRYITRPMLIDGLKFDLRLYMLVSGKLGESGTIEPRYYLFRDGLVRLCTKPYEAPTPETMDQRCMHLTNYAINKNSKDFQQNNGDDHGVGSKRALSWFMNYVEAEFGEKERRKLWHKLMGLCTKTLLTVHPTLEAEYSGAFPKDLTGGQMGCRCFEVLGVDVMLDAKRKPYIIEVNHLPSFTCDSPLDEDIKRRLISQTLDLTCSTITAKDKRTYEQLVRERREGVNTPASMPCQPSPHHDGAALLEVPAYKDFERCYPAPAEAPKLAAQCEVILARVRDVFRPVQAARRSRAASQDAANEAAQSSAPRPPPLPRPPNGPPSASSSAASVLSNATAATKGTSGGETVARRAQDAGSSAQRASPAKKRSRSAPGPPRCALPPIARLCSPRLARCVSASPQPEDRSEGDAGGAVARRGASVRASSRQRTFLPLKSAQILL